MSANLISIMLLVYGLANIVGNVMAGRLLTDYPIRTVTIFPIVLTAVYLIFYFVAELTVPTAIIILVWGILGGLVQTSTNIGLHHLLRKLQILQMDYS